jgi:hypothetical protein
LIQSVDAVVTATDAAGYVEDQGMRSFFLGLLPDSVLNAFNVKIDRPVPIGDMISWNIGLEDADIVSFLTMPEDAEAYATGGILGVIYRTLIISTIIFYANRVFVGRSPTSSILPICIFLMCYHIVSENVAAGQGYYALRVLPQFVVSFYIAVKLARFMEQKSGSHRALLGRST